MSNRLEILRRFVLVVGALCAIGGGLFSIMFALAGNADERIGGILGFFAAAAAFFAYRATVNWVLMHKSPTHPQQRQKSP